MKPPPFAYARPATLDEALDMIIEGGDEAKFLAGGQSLLPLLSYRLARPTHLVDIGRLPGLDRIDRTGGGLALGGLVRHAQLEGAAELAGPWRAIREAAAQIGHLPIRERGTIGGSIAHADPSAELPVVATALDAAFVLRSAAGTRTVPAAGFFTGPFMTVIEPAEALVSIDFPTPPLGLRSAFEEFTARSGDFALASAAVAIATGEDGIVRQVRIVLGSVGPLPLRALDAEASLDGVALTPEAAKLAARVAAAETHPGEDAFAGPEFRRELVETVVVRALTRLMDQGGRP
ncbi:MULTISPECIES: FAD binding domain-containing protein [Actinomadura]|uniref:Xanthine dehydrogenase family protein subunit M n=1 Tax=Actinomadura geliboluensis TaxID=882440 RepID=A0A5S4HBK9_9ACTN|nr:FAD binding domain-containing protein [Actinomadura geliboluensis]TMR42366.1 xanthine dehydrogenase family protein subunit M [Actinomadura geliboluensis]